MAGGAERVVVAFARTLEVALNVVLPVNAEEVAFAETEEAVLGAVVIPEPLEEEEWILRDADTLEDRKMEDSGEYDVLGSWVELGERADWLAGNEDIAEGGVNDERVDVESERLSLCSARRLAVPEI
jgi:hypothetical protein